MAALDGRVGTETMPGVFAQIGMQYLHEHDYAGTPFELFAKISEKNHAHSTLNPLAAYTKRMSLEQIMGDVMIAYPNTRPMCSANCDGAAAAVVCNGETLKSLALQQRKRAVKVSASILTTDPFEDGCQVLPNVNTLTRNAAATAYEQAGIGPGDLDLVELHDCFATAELVHYDNLMLCEKGGAADVKEAPPFMEHAAPPCFSAARIRHTRSVRSGPGPAEQDRLPRANKTVPTSRDPERAAGASANCARTWPRSHGRSAPPVRAPRPNRC